MQNKIFKFNLKLISILIFFILLNFLNLNSASATVRYGAVPGRSGLSFRNINYSHNYLTLEIANRTKYNMTLGGTMLFLDRHGRLAARAELLPLRIKRRGTKRFKAVFTYGSGEDAASAARIEWELSQRNN